MPEPIDRSATRTVAGYYERNSTADWTPPERNIPGIARPASANTNRTFGARIENGLVGLDRSLTTNTWFSPSQRGQLPLGNNRSGRTVQGTTSKVWEPSVVRDAKRLQEQDPGLANLSLRDVQALRQENRFNKGPDTYKALILTEEAKKAETEARLKVLKSARKKKFVNGEGPMLVQDDGFLGRYKKEIKDLEKKLNPPALTRGAELSRKAAEARAKEIKVSHAAYLNAEPGKDPDSLNRAAREIERHPEFQTSFTGFRADPNKYDEEEEDARENALPQETRDFRDYSDFYLRGADPEILTPAELQGFGETYPKKVENWILSGKINYKKVLDAGLILSGASYRSLDPNILSPEELKLCGQTYPKIVNNWILSRKINYKKVLEAGLILSESIYKYLYNAREIPLREIPYNVWQSWRIRGQDTQ